MEKFLATIGIQAKAFWEEDRLSLSGFDKIESIRFTDITENGFSELIITTNSTMHFLLGTSLVEYFYTDVEPGTITNAYNNENLTMFSFVNSSDGT